MIVFDHQARRCEKSARSD